MSSSRYRGKELGHRVGREGEIFFIFFSREHVSSSRHKGGGHRLHLHLSKRLLVSGSGGDRSGMGRVSPSRGVRGECVASTLSSSRRREGARGERVAPSTSRWWGGIRARGCNQLHRRFASAPPGKSSSSSSSSSSLSSSSAKGSSSSASLHRGSSRISTRGGTSRRE